LSQVATELYIRNFIFDYATVYYWSHPDIKSPENIKVTDSDYTAFKEYLKKRNFTYKTSTEESFSDLIETAKREKYYDQHKDLFSTLEKDLAHSIDQDLDNFRPEITDILEDEIIRRYFYEEGALAVGIKKDEQVNKATEILNNRKLYESILKGTEGATLVTGKTSSEKSVAAKFNRRTESN
jgi:carboxyl-terminal processing protease